MIIGALILGGGIGLSSYLAGRFSGGGRPADWQLIAIGSAAFAAGILIARMGSR